MNTWTVNSAPAQSTPDHASALLLPPAQARCVTLPSGRAFELDRSRWDGPLDPEEFAWCRAHDVPLGFDCAQIGWVTQYCRDDDAYPDGFEPERSPVVRDAGTEAQRLCATIRSVARGWAVRAQTDTARAEAESHVLATIDTMVREFAAAHGVRAANSLHWALRTSLARELPRPPQREVPEPIEFTFRSWSPEDAPVYRTMLDNPRLWQFLPEPFPSPLTEATARTLIEIGSIDSRQESLAVEHERRPVGQCLLRFDEPFVGVRSAEVAYWLAEEHWGQGWMTMILSRFLRRSLRAHAVDVIYAWIHADHAASVRVAERCGLRRDTFALEPELTAAMHKPRFRRWATYRSDRPVDEARAPLS